MEEDRQLTRILYDDDDDKATNLGNAGRDELVRAVPLALVDATQ